MRVRDSHPSGPRRLPARGACAYSPACHSLARDRTRPDFLNFAPWGFHRIGAAFDAFKPLVDALSKAARDATSLRNSVSLSVWRSFRASSAARRRKIKVNIRAVHGRLLSASQCAEKAIGCQGGGACRAGNSWGHNPNAVFSTHIFMLKQDPMGALKSFFLKIERSYGARNEPEERDAPAVLENVRSIKTQLKKALGWLINGAELPKEITDELRRVYQAAIDHHDFNKAGSVLKSTNETIAAKGRETHTVLKLNDIRGVVEGCFTLIDELQKAKGRAVLGQPRITWEKDAWSLSEPLRDYFNLFGVPDPPTPPTGVEDRRLGEKGSGGPCPASADRAAHGSRAIRRNPENHDAQATP